MTIAHVLSTLFPSKTITGCKEMAPMLQRWTVLTTPWGSLRVHHFLRSDLDRDLHNHPWDYVTLVLAGGYIEHRPNKRIRDLLAAGDKAVTAFGLPESVRERFFARPGLVLRRPSWWAHRVEIPDGHDAWTLVWMARKTVPWGFFTTNGWVPWRKYQSLAACVSDSELSEVPA